MAVIDTNVLIDLGGRSGKPKQSAAHAKLAEQVLRGEQLFITCFTVAELLVGVYRAADPAGERKKVETALARFPILDFTPAAMDRYGSLVAGRRTIGETMETIDALIAAVALASNETTLITRNVRHFNGIPGLMIESY